MSAVKNVLAVAARLLTPHTGRRGRRRSPLAMFPLSEDVIPFAPAPHSPKDAA